MIKKSAAVLALLLAALGPALARAADEPPATSEQSVAKHEGEAAEGHEESEQEFNWAYGFVGEKEGAPPSLLYRPKGMPPPFLANLLNFAVLFAIIVGAGRKPIVEGLRKRKERIVQGMQEAGRMKDEAAKRLAEYEEKVKHIDSEVQRIRHEMREAADAERRRILTEAKERRERMERDAHLLVEQETKAARESLAKETVVAAMRSAEEYISRSLSVADREKMNAEYVDTLRRAPLGLSGSAS